MKRVLFLALLIVSIVEFTIERNRLYLLFTTVALAGLIYGSFHDRHRIQAAPRLLGHATQRETNEIAR